MPSDETYKFRDLRPNLRHREYGDLPCLDLDLLAFTEYDHGKAVGLTALVEHKHANWTSPGSLDHPSMLALKALADGDHPPLPLVIARYHPDEWLYDVFPVNEAAREHFPRRITRISEREWCTFLHSLRGQVPPPEVLARLKGLPAWMTED